MCDMYDVMVDDYLTGDGYWLDFNAKVKLFKKFGFNGDNFTEEEVEKLKQMRKDGLL